MAFFVEITLHARGHIVSCDDPAFFFTIQPQAATKPPEINLIGSQQLVNSLLAFKLDQRQPGGYDPSLNLSMGLLFGHGAALHS